MTNLIFVYNKDSGFMNGIFDFFHKVMKPTTYNCSLCQITFNYIGMRAAWKTFLSSLPMESKFYHKDEFNRLYSAVHPTSFPAIFLEKDKEIIQIVTTEELNETDLVELRLLLKIPVSFGQSETQVNTHTCLLEEATFMPGLGLNYGLQNKLVGGQFKFYYAWNEKFCFGPEITQSYNSRIHQPK